MVLVDVSQSQCPVSLRGAVNSLSPGFGLSDGVLAAGSRDGLLNRLDWSVSYVDSCFSCLMKPYVLIYLRFSFMDVVEDECNGSVGSRWACLRKRVSGDAAGHSVVACIALRHPGSVEV